MLKYYILYRILSNNTKVISDNEAYSYELIRNGKQKGIITLFIESNGWKCFTDLLKLPYVDCKLAISSMKSLIITKSNIKIYLIYFIIIIFIMLIY